MQSVGELGGIASLKPQDQSLLIAARDGSLEGIVAALKAGADPNVEGEVRGSPYEPRVAETPLTLICSTNPVLALDGVKCLINSGALVNRKATSGISPILAAARASSIWYSEPNAGDLIRELVQAGSEANDEFKDRTTALHACINKRELGVSLDAVKALLCAGADPDKGPVDRTSALVDAIYIYLRSDRQECFEVVEALVDAGAMVKFPLYRSERCSEVGSYSPALVATVTTPFAKESSVERMLRYLLSKGADPDMPYQGVLLRSIIVDTEIKAIFDAAKLHEQIAQRPSRTMRDRGRRLES